MTVVCSNKRMVWFSMSWKLVDLRGKEGEGERE